MIFKLFHFDSRNGIHSQIFFSLKSIPKSMDFKVYRFQHVHLLCYSQSISLNVYTNLGYPHFLM
jgi:hypothetical protein